MRSCALRPQLKRDPLGAMLDPRLLSDPRLMNQPVSPRARWPLAFILAGGFGLCLALDVDTLRHWEDRPHPVFQLLFLTVVGLAAAVVALRLFRGDPVIKPVQRPPRAIIIRVLGLLILSICGLVALVSESCGERVEFGTMALGGLGSLLWPTQFYPPQREHGA